MFGQFSTCDLVEFQRLLWSGGRREISGVQGNNTTTNNTAGVNNQIIVGQQQFLNSQQQPTIITGIHQPVGGVITTNTNSTIIQNAMPVPRQHNFLNNQTSVSFTTQPTTRYIPNQPRNVNQTTHHVVVQQQQQQQQTQPHFSQIVPLDLGKQAQEARAREMVPEFEEQYFIQSSSPAKISPVGRGHGQSSQSTHLHRPQPHIPTSQAISEHLSRAYPQQDLIQMHHRQRMMQEQTQETQQHRNSKKSGRHNVELYETEMHEMEVDDHQNDDDYAVEEEEDEDEEEEEYEEYEPVQDEGPWKCGSCRKIYKRKANFLSHQKTCKKVNSGNQQHAQGPAFKCTLCDQCFLTDKTFQRHMKTHENPQSAPSGKRHSKQKQLQAAISSISGSAGVGVNQYQQQQYQVPILFQFKCDFCQEQFAVQQQLKAHEQLHLAESTLRCVTCDKPFLREEEFNLHIKSHLTETVWKCTVCNTKFDEYKAYKDHLQSHLPVVYKEPPPKPPEPEKPAVEEGKTDDDILEMEVINEDGTVDTSKSPNKSAKDEKRSKLDDLAGAEWVPLPKPSTSRAAVAGTSRSGSSSYGGKSRYATGSNIKVTGKAAQSRDAVVRRIPNASNPKESIVVTTPSSSSAGNKDDDDDDIVILSAPTTPHRPIPIRVTTTANGKKYITMKGQLPNTKLGTPMSSQRKGPPASLHRPPPSNKHKPLPPNKRPSAPPKQRHSAPIYNLTIDTTYKFQCSICKSYLPNKPALQQHILSKHCRQKSIVIKLLKLEDDPELDLEIIDDDMDEPSMNVSDI